jgi:hypothetical protein
VPETYLNKLLPKKLTTRRLAGSGSWARLGEAGDGGWRASGRDRVVACYRALAGEGGRGRARRGGAAGGRRLGEARDGGSSKCDRESELTGRVWNIAEN